MSVDNELRCDECFTSNKDVPIIEKPTRFGYKNSIVTLDQNNENGRTEDNICLDCLEVDIKRQITDWF